MTRLQSLISAFGPVSSKGCVYVPEGQRANWNYLLNAVGAGNGINLIVGEQATGKTTLGLWLYQSLSPKSHEAVFVSQQHLDAGSVLKPISRLFGISGSSKIEQLQIITSGLDELAEEQRSFVVFLDSDNKPFASGIWQEIDALLQMQTVVASQLTFIVIGPEKLSQTLAGNPQLKSRLIGTHKCVPLSANETYAYLCHRIQAAGGERRVVNFATAEQIHLAAEGNFYRMNALIKNAILHAISQHKDVIEIPDVIVASAVIRGEPITFSSPTLDTGQNDRENSLGEINLEQPCTTLPQELQVRVVKETLDFATPAKKVFDDEGLKAVSIEETPPPFPSKVEPLESELPLSWDHKINTKGSDAAPETDSQDSSPDSTAEDLEAASQEERSCPQTEAPKENTNERNPSDLSQSSEQNVIKEDEDEENTISLLELLKRKNAG